ncbi:uncharacterized protein V1516DRAFT_681987 [Lipomyces oligophaga]|uniref:uncharacterized protein n=1 Tax=Lipomyces oligophaga TaxID=45792 RepID=UPI0034CF021F
METARGIIAESVSESQNGSGTNYFSILSDGDDVASQTSSTMQFSRRNLVLCLDGSASKFGQRPASNVLKIFQMLDLSIDNVLAYYQPGVGSYIDSDSGMNHFSSRWKSLMFTFDSIAAYSFSDHIIACYRFLLRYYQYGDRIWIFGFSRGALTALVLSRLIETVGLLRPGGEELAPCAWEIYKNWLLHQDKSIFDPSRGFADALARKFKATFARPVPEIYFLGLWDCVTAVGLLRPRTYLPAKGEEEYQGIVTHVRHALSIDERRVNFRYSDDVFGLDVVEQWFPGNHSDIGGGWQSDKRSLAGVRLSDLSLRWMIREVYSLGLPLRTEYIRKIALPSLVEQVILAPAHDMLSFSRIKGKSKRVAAKWWFLEFLPWPLEYSSQYGTKRRPDRHGKINLGRRRLIPDDALIHWSALWKQILDKRYRPKNLPEDLWYAKSAYDQILQNGVIPDDILDDEEIMAAIQESDILDQNITGQNSVVSDIQNVDNQNSDISVQQNVVTHLSINHESDIFEHDMMNQNPNISDKSMTIQDWE